MLQETNITTNVKNVALVDGVPLGTVEESDLELIRNRGFNVSSSQAVGETIIARVLKGNIDFKKLPRNRLRIRYCAAQARHNEVLIKVIERQFVSLSFMTRDLLSDCRTIGRLTFHENIAMYYDIFQSRSAAYLVSEATPGVDVISYMEAFDFSESEARQIFNQICTAFIYAHGKGIIHRDLKPACVIVNDQGHVKIHDFGLNPKLSVVHEAQLHETTKRAYISPEVIQLRQYESKEADVYSIGILLYGMLHGCVPYTGNRNEMLTQIQLCAPKFYPRITKEAKILIKKMIHHDPWRRPKVMECADNIWNRIHQSIKPGLKHFEAYLPVSQTVLIQQRILKRAGYHQNTVKCGDHHVKLRSRIPDKRTAMAFNLNFGQMFTVLQNKQKHVKKKDNFARRKIEINPEPMLMLKKNIPTLHHAKALSCIKKSLTVSCIRKPKDASDALEEISRCNLYVPDEVFWSKPASSCSTVSVMAFDHADSEFSCKASTVYSNNVTMISPDIKVPEDDGDGKYNRIPPLIFTSPSTCVSSETDSIFTPEPLSTIAEVQALNAPCLTDTNPDLDTNPDTSSKLNNQVIESVLSETTDIADIVTEMSFKSDRASSVPTDLGSQEPPLAIQPLTFAANVGHNAIEISQVMQLPGISKEEHVNQFLSTVMYDDTLVEPIRLPKSFIEHHRHPIICGAPRTTVTNITTQGRRLSRPPQYSRSWTPIAQEFANNASTQSLPPLKGTAMILGNMNTTNNSTTKSVSSPTLPIPYIEKTDLVPAMSVGTSGSCCNLSLTEVDEGHSTIDTRQSSTEVPQLVVFLPIEHSKSNFIDPDLQNNQTIVAHDGGAGNYRNSQLQHQNVQCGLDPPSLFTENQAPLLNVKQLSLDFKLSRRLAHERAMAYWLRSKSPAQPFYC